MIIKTGASDEDFIIKGNDGGSEITALTLDMSNAGKATFNDGVVATTGTFSGALAGTLSTAAQTNVTSLGTLTALTVDDITINGSTISDSGAFDIDVGGNITLDADGGTITFADAGSSLGTITSSGYSGTAAVATTVTITDNESTNENNAIIFTAGGDLDGGNLGLESDGDLYYNPSTGTLSVTNIVTSGTHTVTNSVTMNASNAVVFEGATADAHETTLSTIDATGDRTINLPNVSGTLPVLAAASTTQITSTPEELNILDGVTATAAEINLIDGDTSRGTTAIADADGFLVNDAGTMYLMMEKQHNRGQDGAGFASIKLDPTAGERYISRVRSNKVFESRNWRWWRNRRYCSCYFTCT